VSVADAADAVLKLEGLEKRFGGVVAADRLSLSLRAGEVLGVVGPNGAGKSTLFNLICGTIPADAGAVLLGGRDISRMAAHRRARLGISRTWQHVRLFPSLSVLDNLVMGGRDYPGESLFAALLRPPGLHRAMAETTRAAEAALEDVGLSHRAGHRVAELSYGQQKLVGLARALMNDGPVLLLDEPLAGVDPRNQITMRKIIDQQATRGRAVCVIEHNIGVLRELAARMVFMFAGRAEAEGAPAAILSDPRLRRIYFGGAA
jgi:branched-chain amino acid transport system ATP-binding protein